MDEGAFGGKSFEVDGEGFALRRFDHEVTSASEISSVGRAVVNQANSASLVLFGDEFEIDSGTILVQCPDIPASGCFVVDDATALEVHEDWVSGGMVDLEAAITKTVLVGG